MFAIRFQWLIGVSFYLLIKMEQVIEYSEGELIELREELTSKLSQMKGGLFKKKLKLIGKSLLKLTLIVGGVAVAVIFPSTVVIAVLGGVLAVVDGTKGTMKSIKKTKHENKRRKQGKKDLKEVENELIKKKTVREFFEQHPPSAPPPRYPSI